MVFYANYNEMRFDELSKMFYDVPLGFIGQMTDAERHVGVILDSI